MCGIIAVVRKPGIGPIPSAAELSSTVADAVDAFDPSSGQLDAALLALASAMQGVDRSLRGVAGVAALVADPAIADAVGATLDAASAKLSMKNA